MAWIPDGPIFADYSSTDDADLDAELILLEDDARPFDEIAAACRKYKVRARLFQPLGYFIGEVLPDGTLRA